MARVFVLMSGGVDSSCSALLLKRAGFDVVGIHLRMTSLNNCSYQDFQDAKQVAEILDIPFYVIDIEEDYKRLVMEKTIEDYKKGITPNPDVLCNSEIKFGLFLNKVANLNDNDFIASGHYAKKEGELIKIPKDKEKDQTYFLWKIKKEILKRIIFPLGDLKKEEVRKIAAENNLPVAYKKDSQGLCFVGKIKFSEFLKTYLPTQKGYVYDKFGNLIGYHYGYYFYTLGQRHGFWAKNGPWYVAKKDVENNVLVVAKENDEILYKDEIYYSDENYFKEIKDGEKIMVRIRYRQKLIPAYIYPSEKKVVFIEKAKLPTPGQSIVFYKDDFLLGGGVIL
jgi:tRNA-specific 2-thiouridylase